MTASQRRKKPKMMIDIHRPQDKKKDNVTTTTWENNDRAFLPWGICLFSEVLPNRVFLVGSSESNKTVDMTSDMTCCEMNRVYRTFGIGIQINIGINIGISIDKSIYQFKQCN